MDPDSTNVTDDPKFQCGFLCGYLLGTGQLDANTIRDLPQLSHTFTHPARPARPYQIPGELIDQDLEVRPTHLRARPYQVPANLIHQDFAGRLAIRAESGTNSSSTTRTGSKRGSHHLDAAREAKRRRFKKRFNYSSSPSPSPTNASAEISDTTASAKRPTTASAKRPTTASAKRPTTASARRPTTASAKIPATTASAKIPATTASSKRPTTTASTKVPKHEPKHESKQEPKHEPKREPKQEPIDLSYPPAPRPPTNRIVTGIVYPTSPETASERWARAAMETGYGEAVTKGMFLNGEIKVEGRRAYTINRAYPCSRCIRTGAGKCVVPDPEWETFLSGYTCQTCTRAGQSCSSCRDYE